MSDLFGSLASASGYGHSNSYGGYGKEIECNSALGLIGLLGLIELLRDIIENMVTMSEETTRRRRSVAHGGVFRNSFVGTLFRGEAANHNPLGTLPALLLPLLHSAVDASDGLHSPACFERTICETNRALVSKGLFWGFPGAFLANSTSSLISKVVAKAFTNDGESYQKAIQAGDAGRSGINCEVAYSSCLTLQPRHSVPTVDVNTLVKQHLAGLT